MRGGWGRAIVVLHIFIRDLSWRRTRTHSRKLRLACFKLPAERADGPPNPQESLLQAHDPQRRPVSAGSPPSDKRTAGPCQPPRRTEKPEQRMGIASLMGRRRPSCVEQRLRGQAPRTLAEQIAGSTRSHSQAKPYGPTRECVCRITGCLRRYGRLAGIARSLRWYPAKR